MSKAVIPLLVVFVLFQAFEYAQAQISQEFKAQIERILSEPQKVYQVSVEDNARQMQTIDAFFHEKMALNKAKEIKQKTGPGTTRSRQLKENIVVLSDTVITDRTQLEKPITIWYESSPRKRSFHKDLERHSATALPKGEVTRMAQTFITRNKFYRNTTMDSLAGSEVLSRKWSSSEDEFREEDKKTILQRVVFKRTFNGLEVLGSKQIVDIHPETREMLSYKSIRWTPVDERTGREYAYLSKDEVVAHIDSVLGVSTNRSKIVSIKSAYLQTDDMLVPVMAVQSSVTGLSPRDRPSEKRTLLVYLAKDLPRPSRTVKARLPGNPQ